MFRAYDARHERLVAVKLFKLDIPPDAAHRLVADLERVIAARLTHPVIVAPTSAGVADVSTFLVSDYVTAESLDLSARERGALTPADALRMARAVAGALDAAAAVSVRHGSLHPRDILLSGDDVRLTGLGVAQSIDQIGVLSPVRRPYTAPERMTLSLWDRRADVFSLAAIVYEALVGRRIAGVGKQTLDGLADMGGVDLHALSRAFAEALAGEPSERTPTAGKFVAALKAACGDLESAFEPSAAIRRARKLQLAGDPRPATGEGRPMPAPEPLLPLLADDFVRRPVEENRFVDVQLSPTAEVPVTPEKEVETSFAAAPGHTDAVEEGPSPSIELTMLDRSRSAVWPLGLSMLVGATLGFAGGYAVGTGDHSGQRQAVAAGTTQAPAGREFTESAVGELPKASPPKPTPPVDVRPAPTPPAPAPATDTRIGRLVIRTTPAGARVFVDGREARRSPTSVDDLAPGTHRLRLIHDGYAVDERDFVISRTRPTETLAVALARPRVAAAVPPAPAPAAPQRAAPAATPLRATPTPAVRSGSVSLTVESRPVGAKVFIDDQLVGTTPLSVPDVVVGDHVLRMERDGYRRWASSIRVVAGEANRVTASLER